MRSVSVPVYDMVEGKQVVTSRTPDRASKARYGLCTNLQFPKNLKSTLLPTHG